jgi:hypothetical protein
MSAELPFLFLPLLAVVEPKTTPRDAALVDIQSAAAGIQYLHIEPHILRGRQ